MRIDFKHQFGVLTAGDLVIWADAEDAGVVAATGRGIRMDRRRRFLAAYLGD